MTWPIWLIAAVVLVIVELLSLSFACLMLAGGCVVAGVVGIYGAGLELQLLAFACTSLVLLFLVRPWAKEYLTRSTPNIETNAMALIGQEAVVVAILQGNEGRVRIGGEEWSARTAPEDEGMLVGTRVRVERIDGASVFVRRIE